MTEVASVYVFGAGDGLVKVGVSGDTKARAAQLRAMLPGGRMIYERSADSLRSRRAERLAHGMLSTHCIGGEWFAIDDGTAIMAVDGALDTTTQRPAKPVIPSYPASDAEMNGRLLATARLLLGWSQSKLAEKADVSRRTIISLETGDGEPKRSTEGKVIETLQAHGIEFTETKGLKGVAMRLSGGAGVRLKDGGRE